MKHRQALVLLLVLRLTAPVPRPVQAGETPPPAAKPRNGVAALERELQAAQAALRKAKQAVAGHAEVQAAAAAKRDAQQAFGSTVAEIIRSLPGGADLQARLQALQAEQRETRKKLRGTAEEGPEKAALRDTAERLATELRQQRREMGRFWVWANAHEEAVRRQAAAQAANAAYEDALDAAIRAAGGQGAAALERVAALRTDLRQARQAALVARLTPQLRQWLARDAKPKAEARTPLHLPRLADRIARGLPITLVCYGDSISEVGRSPNWHGGASEPAWHWGSLLRDRLQERYPEATFHVKWFGIGGQNSFEGLGRVDALWDLEPHLVLIAFGANDCMHHELRPEQTKTALAELVERVQPRADVVLLSTGGSGPGNPHFQHVEETVAATEAVARAHAAPFVDIYTAMRTVIGNGGTWQQYHPAVGNCHPNDAGHMVWALATFLLLEAALPETGDEVTDE